MTREQQADEPWGLWYKSRLGEQWYRKLRKFLDVVESIRKRPFFQDPPDKFSIRIERVETGYVTTTDKGTLDIDLLRSALIDIRRLLLERDDTFINALVNRLIEVEDERDRAELLRQEYDKLRQYRRTPAYFLGPPELFRAGGAAFQQALPSLKPARTRAQLLDRAIYRNLFHTDDPDRLPDPPDLSQTDVSDAEVLEGYQLVPLVEMMFAEAAFASWLSIFVKAKAPGANDSDSNSAEGYLEKDDDGQ